MKHIRTHHMAISYPHTIRERLYSLLVGPLLIALVIYLTYSFFHVESGEAEVTVASLVTASFYTLGRLLTAYALSAIVAIPLALLATANKTLGLVMLPVFDILESVPILAFFPVVVVLFVHINFIEGAAIFILFLNMLWNIVFTVVGGLKLIPKDITYAARIFGLSRLSYLRRITLPAVFPQFVTGSILAVAEGWNLIIVAEAIHTYIPHGNPSQDLYGIGSMLVQAAASGQNGAFVEALVVMILFIAFFNIFVWQRLLTYSQRFRFD